MHKDYRWLLIGAEQPRQPQPAANTSLLLRDPDEIHLFARGHESIRITIRTTTKTLLVFGPGRAQKFYEFATEAELQEFLQSYEQDALKNGWTLLDVNDRRIANRS
jgi:hypothetical protein